MKGNTASMIALIVAGLVLLVVGGNSYSNYLRAQYEREYGVLGKHQKAAAANPVAGAGSQGVANAVISTLDSGNSMPAPLAQSSPSATMPVGGGQPNQASPAYGTGAPEPTRRSSSASTSADPEIAQLEAKLEAARQESILHQQKLNQMRGGNSGSAVSQTESGSLREVMSRADGDGASAALFPKEGASGRGQMAEYEKQITNASAVAKVVAFNADWGFVQIDAGKNRNVTVGTRFAIRRRSDIVGYVKVTEVNDAMAIAELTSSNEFIETARKPKPGDDVITWPLF